MAPGVNSSGFSTRHMSWLAGAKDPVTGSKGGVAVRDGSESTGSVSPSSDSDEVDGRNNRSDSSVSTDGALSDGALSDGPLSGVDGVVEGFGGSSSIGSSCGNGGGANGVVPSGVRSAPAVTEGSNGHLAPANNGLLKANGSHHHNVHQTPQTPANGISSSAAATIVVGNGNGNGDGLDLPPDRFRILQGVSRAFHSPAMALAASGTEAAARRVSLRDPAVPLASNVTGRLAEEGELTDPAYWGRHVLGTVRFHDGLTALTSAAVAPPPAGGGQQAGPTLLSEGITTFVEVGPSALLCGMGRRALRDGGGARGDPAAAASLRWIAAMSAEERIAGKSGLGHVVGAVRGVHYRRKSYPWNDSAAPRSAVKKAAPNGGSGCVDGGGSSGSSSSSSQRRPPLRVLETKWVSVGELSSPSHGGSKANGGGGREDLSRGDSAATGPVQAGSDDEDGEEEEEESVWLLAGRTGASYATLSDVISGADSGDGGATEGDSGGGRGGGLAHLLTLGPTAAGGETAAIGRLARCGSRAGGRGVGGRDA